MPGAPGPERVSAANFPDSNRLTNRMLAPDPAKRCGWEEIAATEWVSGHGDPTADEIRAVRRRMRAECAHT